MSVIISQNSREKKSNLIETLEYYPPLLRMDLPYEIFKIVLINLRSVNFEELYQEALSHKSSHLNKSTKKAIYSELFSDLVC